MYTKVWMKPELNPLQVLCNNISAYCVNHFNTTMYNPPKQRATVKEPFMGSFNCWYKQITHAMFIINTKNPSHFPPQTTLNHLFYGVYFVWNTSHMNALGGRQIHTHRHTHAYARMHIHAYTQTHIHSHTVTHTHTHTHTQTHTHRHTQSHRHTRTQTHIHRVTDTHRESQTHTHTTTLIEHTHSTWSGIHCILVVG